MIMSILDEHPEGLTGYAIIREIQSRFGPMRRISAGTIYPKLERLTGRGDIIEEGNLYKITSQGHERLSQKVPEVIESNIEFMPRFLDNLMHTLPFGHRMNFIRDKDQFFGKHDFYAAMHAFDDILEKDPQTKTELGEMVSQLQKIKTRLEETKTRVQERVKARLSAIEEKMKFIDAKIERYQNSQENWKSIPVEKDDNTED
jgi:DNA-binding PadR family transcriptional regulator